MPTRNNLLVANISLDACDTPIFIKNNNGVYVYCNRAFIDFLGIPKHKILGNTAHDISPTALADIYTEADKQLFLSQGCQNYEASVQTNKNKIKAIFKKAIVYTPKHEIAGFVGSIERVTLESHTLGDVKKLTSREFEVLKLLSKGQSTKIIAHALNISHHTVSDHLKSIYLKLDAHSKTEAIYKALILFALPTL